MQADIEVREGDRAWIRSLHRVRRDRAARPARLLVIPQSSSAWPSTYREAIGRKRVSRGFVSEWHIGSRARSGRNNLDSDADIGQLEVL
jgi:hypothetical protein